MKNNITFLCFCLSVSLLFTSAAFGASPIGNKAFSEEIKAPANSNPEKSVSKFQQNKLDHEKERGDSKLIRHEIKEKLKEHRKNKSGVSTVLLVILAILIPPLAVLLVDGLKGPFWLDILLTLLFLLPGIIYALYRVLRSE
jgi:uncharacterized membrane protein YqaE (UPF0057 family)